MVFDTVTYLARAYFHQDFDLIAPTPEGVVEEFIVHEDPATTDQLRRELEELTKGHVSEDECGRLGWHQEDHPSTLTDKALVIANGSAEYWSYLPLLDRAES
jgi:hypothetical protein